MTACRQNRVISVIFVLSLQSFLFCYVIVSICVCVCVCVCMYECVWCREDGILTLHCPISDLPSEWSPPTLTAAVYAKLASLAQEFHNKAKIERILSPFFLIYSRAVSIADVSDRDYKFVLDLRGLGSYPQQRIAVGMRLYCRLQKDTETNCSGLTEWLAVRWCMRIRRD